VPEKFHPWIKVFGKKQSERMPTRKVWDHAIEVKEGFMPRKGKCYELKPLGLDGRTTLVLSNTRELDRDSFTN